MKIIPKPKNQKQELVRTETEQKKQNKNLKNTTLNSNPFHSIFLINYNHIHTLKSLQTRNSFHKP